jgi:hypothetical protein
VFYPLLSHLSSASTLADLPASAVRLDVGARGQQVAEEFERRPDLPGVILDDGPGTAGAISRQNFFRLISGPFGREIFLRRPIGVMARSLSGGPLRLPGW